MWKNGEMEWINYRTPKCSELAPKTIVQHDNYHRKLRESWKKKNKEKWRVHRVEEISCGKRDEIRTFQRKTDEICISTENRRNLHFNRQMAKFASKQRSLIFNSFESAAKKNWNIWKSKKKLRNFPMVSPKKKSKFLKKSQKKFSVELPIREILV
jgi:hypothetical protein